MRRKILLCKIVARVRFSIRRCGPQRRPRYFPLSPRDEEKLRHVAVADHDHTDPPSDPALRVKALEPLLVEKGLIDPDVGEFADYYEHRVGPRNGAKVVGRAWVDPATASVFSPMVPRPSPSFSPAASRARKWWCWRTRRRRTVSSHLHAVLVLPVANAGPATDLV